MNYLFNKALIKEQLKRFWAISALSFAAYFLCVLLPLWSVDTTLNNQEAIHQFFNILKMNNKIMMFASIIVPLIAVAIIFTYMYQPNSTGVMHSLPFTKKQLFLSNAISGYLLIIIPLLFFALLLIIKPIELTTFNSQHYTYIHQDTIANFYPNGLNIYETINTLPVIIGYFMRILITFTFYYCLFVFAATLVGNPVIHFLISGVLPFIGVGIYLLFEVISFYYVTGYYPNTTLIRKIGIYTNPILIQMTYENTGEKINLWPYYLVYILIIVALFSLSYYLYHIRKLERAGDTVVFTPIKNTCIFILSIAGMILLGIFLLALFKSLALLYVGFAIGFVISYFIAQMIAEKSFNIIYKYKELLKYTTVTIVIFGVILVITKTDITGYEKYIPNTSEVEAVHLSWPRSNLENIKIKEQYIIEETIVIHEKMIENRKQLRKSFLRNLTENTFDEMIRSQCITYILKNGKTITRQYFMPETFYNESGLNKLQLEEAVIIADNAYWINNPSIIKSINLYSNNNAKVNSEGEQFTITVEESLDIYVTDDSEIASLVEAVKKDYIQSQRSEYDNNANYKEYSISGRTKDEEMHFSMGIWQTENTTQWLINHGYEVE